MHCRRFLPQPLTRREILGQAANGFGGVALAALLREPAYGEPVYGAALADADQGSPLGAGAALAALHHAPKARNVIFLYMDGGPSQVDTFDPKPRLEKDHGKPIPIKTPPTQFNNVGNVLACPWPFKQHGQSGIPVSSLFPHLAQHVDKLAVVRSMVSNFSEHTNANYFLHTGSGLQGRPCMGAWTTYGLGSVCQELPGFIVLNGGLMPRGGLDNFTNGFLPATFQGSVFKSGAAPVANIDPPTGTPPHSAPQLALLKKLDQGVLARMGDRREVEAAIANYELAYRMQSAVPSLMDLSQETARTKHMYGFEAGNEATKIYAQQCLLARRLVERGVRFVEVTCPAVAADRWDQHADLVKGHELNALAVDQPIAALLDDLGQRGLLESTLVVWGGEFGRTPMAQGANGRDHNPFGFTMWLAGGGVRGGVIHGATDDFGYFVVENKVEIHDLHATMLHLLGVDHERLTYRFSGRDMRLTDVHGRVVQEILA